MDLRQLRYFIAVAEERSFSRASLRLHVSQPPLSTQLKALEDELGVRLLDRSNRGVTLTTAGQVFFDETRAVLARLERGKVKARNAGRGDVGTLSIGFVSIADYGILPPALKEFRTLYPGVEVHLHELTTDTQIREIRASRLDLGIGLGPVEGTDLLFEPVIQEKLVLAAPTGHRLIRGSKAVDLKTLSNESFVIPPRDIAPGLFDLVIGRCRAAGFAPRITQQARQMQTVISLVSCGMGFALVPASVQNLRRKGVQYRPLRGAATAIDIGVLRSRDSDEALSGHFVSTLLRVARASEPRSR
ncbi:LysR family transcriptional regulator [Panacagrimonas perspica]|uniref:LysR family transcriptional regulator n=1 Tax=Panacagrimonas perspica TaxID=381431 RepID=A0A4S3K4H1_9GAMM|nr:LysR family transcriptional regulator [Panacagrimonas perspica]TDU31820.1 LysR family transcriptional regulator [Panacagrimonas perspica]THD02973.1 LysR family transcriptional regulator [Panacagrimonas perspica]